MLRRVAKKLRNNCFQDGKKVKNGPYAPQDSYQVGNGYGNPQKKLSVWKFGYSGI